MKFLLLAPLVLLQLVSALHCWKESSRCHGSSKLKYASSCDTPANRIKDLRGFRTCLAGFCAKDSSLVFRNRARDGKSDKPSGVVCDKNAHSGNASYYSEHLAGCIASRYPELTKRHTILCCEAGINPGCL
ncbi:hypothetical protein BGZ68_009372 [Mortierella alpina]|nr:hypothetical protein BGZ68_009372 [Mortierella alpina]